MKSLIILSLLANSLISCISQVDSMTENDNNDNSSTFYFGYVYLIIVFIILVANIIATLVMIKKHYIPQEFHCLALFLLCFLPLFSSLIICCIVKRFPNLLVSLTQKNAFNNNPVPVQPQIQYVNIIQNNGNNLQNINQPVITNTQQPIINNNIGEREIVLNDNILPNISQIKVVEYNSSNNEKPSDNDLPPGY